MATFVCPVQKKYKKSKPFTQYYFLLRHWKEIHCSYMEVYKFPVISCDMISTNISSVKNHLKKRQSNRYANYCNVNRTFAK